MNKEEYDKVKDYTYEEYCDYLVGKYGEAKHNYYKENWVKNNGVTRTKEGIVVHHKMEDRAIKLSTKGFAQMNPYEYQKAKNLVYCDYLEHLLLHILIWEKTRNGPLPEMLYGVGGIITYLVPELNDVYSGWVTSQPWRLTCHEKIINDKDVYLILLKRFVDDDKECLDYLLTSFNEWPGSAWSKDKNKILFSEIKNLC